MKQRVEREREAEKAGRKGKIEFANYVFAILPSFPIPVVAGLDLNCFLKCN